MLVCVLACAQCQYNLLRAPPALSQDVPDFNPSFLHCLTNFLNVFVLTSFCWLIPEVYHLEKQRCMCTLFAANCSERDYNARHDGRQYHMGGLYLNIGIDY